MSPELQSALIAAAVALATGVVTGYFTWARIRREREKWLYDIKTTISVDLHVARMAEYARLSKLLIGTSTASHEKLTPAKAHEMADLINEWMYGAGGLMASARTRNAGWALRDRLLRWKEGKQPKDILQVRTLLWWSMRQDLDIPSGREDDLPEDKLIKQLQDEMEQTMNG
jgi:hypothetical protein